MEALRKRVSMANSLNDYQNKLLNIASQLSSIKTAIENMETEVDTDPDFIQEDMDDMDAARTLVNHTNYTSCITFLNNQLGS